MCLTCQWFNNSLKNDLSPIDHLFSSGQIRHFLISEHFKAVNKVRYLSYYNDNYNTTRQIKNYIFTDQSIIGKYYIDVKNELALLNKKLIIINRFLIHDISYLIKKIMINMTLKAINCGRYQ